MMSVAPAMPISAVIGSTSRTVVCLIRIRSMPIGSSIMPAFTKPPSTDLR